MSRRQLQRHRWPGWPIVASFLLGAGTVLVAVRQLFQALAGARSTADQAIFETNVRMALEGVQRVGAYSQGFHHPGPAYFYWLALPYAMLGRTTLSLHVGGQLLTFVFVAAMIFAATRFTANIVLTILFVPALGLELAYLGDFPLFDFWPPYGVLLGYATFLFLAAGFSAGHWSALPAVVIVASLLAQAHVAYGLPVLTGVALAVTFVLLRERAAHRALRPMLRAAAGPIGAALVALTVLWALPVYAEIFEKEGNFRRIYHVFVEKPSRHWQLRALLDRVALEFTGPWQFALFGDRFIVPEAHKHFVAARGLCVAQVWALVIALRNAMLRGDPFIAALCLQCLVALPLAAFTLFGIRGEIAPHHTAWISSLGFAAILAAAAGVLPLYSAAAWLRSAGGRLLLVAAALAALFMLRPIGILSGIHRNPEVATLANAVVAEATREPHGIPVIAWSEEGKIGDQFPPAFPWAIAVMLELEKRHERFVTRRAEAVRWALDRPRWESSSAEGFQVIVSGGSERELGRPLVCIENGDNYLLRYPVCAWAIDSTSSSGTPKLTGAMR